MNISDDEWSEMSETNRNLGHWLIKMCEKNSKFC
jgi:hypothetical protein